MSKKSPRDAERDFAVDILAALEAEAAPLQPRELAARLALRRGDRGLFDDALQALEQRGRVIRNRAGSLLVGRRIAALAGRVEGHSDGHGFLLPDDGGMPVLLPASEMRGLMHGDRAAVRVAGSDARGRRTGTVVEVLERSARRIVGRLEQTRGVLYLVPEDRRIAHDIIVEPGHRDALPGQVVTVELVAAPALHAPPVGRIAEVLGTADDPGMEIEIALRKFDLPHAFPRAALAAAKRLPDDVQVADLEGRRDLRDLAFVTIDGETAKDFDDAVYARREGRGWRLWVAIADVDHYVPAGGALDAAARERGTSVYFPRRVIPMLPESLSNGLCSLNPGVDRLAMVCEMAIGPRGTVSKSEFYPAVIRSRARLTYTAVQAELSGGATAASAVPGGVIDELHALFRRLHEARGRRGAIDFETVETRMIFDPRGRIERIVPEARNDAHRLIEECMLAANVCAGRLLAEAGHPVLYRVHAQPAPEKIDALRRFLGELGLTLGGGDDPSPADYAALVRAIRGRLDFALLQTVLLRSLKQALYSPANEGHFGLAFDAYAHFTSPIRRYPDLLVHRAIKALLAGTRLPATDWHELGRHCSETERRADEAGRDVENWLKCRYMEQHVNGEFEGTITGVTGFGIFVTLDGVFVDGLVHVSELGRDYFHFDPARHVLLGERTGRRYRLADRLRVRVVRVDVATRRMDLVPA